MHLNGSEDSYSANLKRAKYDVNEEVNDEIDRSCNNMEQDSSQMLPPLLRLSDDVLLILMGQLDQRDLMNLGRTCQRLDAVSRDHTLWSKVDLRSHNIMLCQLRDFIEYLHPTTKLIASRGCLHLMNPPSRWTQACSPRRALRDLSKACPRLETFIAVEHFFDARWVSVTDFPPSLKNLTLKACEIYFLPKEKSYFHGIYKHMPNLEVLILDDCQWLTAHSLMAISKCPNLRELSLKSCRNLGECLVYTSLAARFGFKSLKILDVRETSLADNEISCFRKIDSLTHLFLACPRKRTPNDVDPVQACCQANGYHGRSNQVADGVCCSCKDDNSREMIDVCEGECSHTSETDEGVPTLNLPSPSGIVVVNFVETLPGMHGSHPEIRQLPAFIHEDLPEYLETETLITDRGIMQLGTGDIQIVSSGSEDDDDNDHPLSHGGRNKNLSNLIINNCKGVTDSSLAHLAKLSSIKYLNVCGTSVTQYGIQQFLSHRPDVKIVSDFQP
ncbi:hypothetical protein R5R35_013136 [Gryllus longicercus]|uniref:F-box domain-containing protein n=1 Tax=Gryllus longicercus TaxID=2509291 RepID=A0AAN9W1W4_9ORTH|nr:Cytochrome b-c1 complex subunit 1, mitochondrial [Gryllus bimaculatus]